MKPEPLKGKYEEYSQRLWWDKLANQRLSTEASEIFEDIRLACEFYLKYKNNPEGLFTKYRNYTKLFELYLMSTHNFSYVFWLKRYFLSRSIKKKWMALDEYNEWLFKLAFKDVLDGGDKK